MRKKRNILIGSISLTALSFYFLQITFVNTVLAIGQNVPDLLLILAIFVGFRLGPMPGSVFGFVAGFFQDVLTGFYGLQALTKTLIGFFSNLFINQRVLLIEKYYFPLIVFIGSMLHDAFYYWFQSLGTKLEFGSLFIQFGVINSFYNAVLAFLLYLMTPKKFLDFVHYNPRHEFDY